VNIPLIIRDLILRNDQLIIPGFGTFKVIHKPAQINKATKLLLPPSKDIIFDPQQKSGDNQFILTVKKKLGLSEPETIEVLREFLNRLEEEIRVRGSAIIEGVGKLTQDSSGKLKFEPLGEMLKLPGVFALPEIEMPAPRVVEEVKPPTIQTGTPGIPVERTRKKWWIPATAIIIVLLATVAYFTGMPDRFKGSGQKTETVINKEDQANRMVFGNRKSSEKDTLQEAISRQLDERTSREALRFEEKKKQGGDSALQVVAPAKVSSAAGPYHVISGSFLVPDNAERQQAVLREKGLNPELLPRRGKYYMVSLGSYATNEEAAKVVTELKEKLHQELWVMKIK
jgi:nucleoid DNA-binding protein